MANTQLNISIIIFFLTIVLLTMMPTTAQSDKLALLALKKEFTNGALDSLSSWNDSLHFCEWEGVTCGRLHRRRVTVLHLEKQYWGGTLGPTLGNLTFLKKLILSNINLHGEIPRQVGFLKRLQLLDLSFNNLNGEIPRQVGFLKRLQLLHLSMNNLQGEIPMELVNCTNLQIVYLSVSKLTGKVPYWFGSLIQLTSLFLDANNLVGTITTSLGNISSLQRLSLLDNHLHGSIPHALGRLSKLNWLDLGANNLSGVIPSSFYNLSNMQNLNLMKNELHGRFPSNIHLVFPNLRAFLVEENNFTGTFPSSISNLTHLEMFDISSNGFNGQIPTTLGSLKSLFGFYIANNNFGYEKAHDLDFVSSLTNCTQLHKVIFEDNRFGGMLPNVIGNFSTQLSLLSMGRNKISGVIPERIGQLTGLVYLDVGGNFLEGIIPDSIGKLKNLVKLGLYGNKLSGNIPITIGNLTMLSALYLSTNKLEGSIPSFLRYCTQLREFYAFSNKLSGHVPNQTFGYMEGLTWLVLSNNSLTGPINLEFGNMKQLDQLYLDGNKLSGEIPTDLATCLTLTKLSLGRNFFHGGIPSFLGSLRSLEYLDLSNNNFSGTIPHELENLILLKYLDLSFNHLYGEVPTKGVFNNVTTISLTGNKGLCGGIQQFKLPACHRSHSKKHKKLIIIIVICGVLISPIGFIGIYFFTKKPKKLPSSPSLQNRHLRVTYGDLHKATNGFSSSNLLGMGNFGSVYKGSLLRYERHVAVKVLSLKTRGASKSFIAECGALGKVKHRNLLKIVTCCSSVDYNGEDFKAIVFDFMPNGSLENLLHNNALQESGNINWNLMLSVDIALDVAHALDYLHHDSDEVVIHCDVKSSNVLLNDDFVAHLGDFGLARLVHYASGNSSTNQANSSTINGTIGYVPPEYGAGGPISAQGDIYSYGILLLEMLTGKRPTNSMFDETLSLRKFCEMAIPERITEIADSRLLMRFPEDRIEVVENNIWECLVSFGRIGIACSKEFPSHRMRIKDVIVRLQKIKQKLCY